MEYFFFWLHSNKTWVLHVLLRIYLQSWQSVKRYQINKSYKLLFWVQIQYHFNLVFLGNLWKISSKKFPFDIFCFVLVRKIQRLMNQTRKLEILKDRNINQNTEVNDNIKSFNRKRKEENSCNQEHVPYVWTSNKDIEMHVDLNINLTWLLLIWNISKKHFI